MENPREFIATFKIGSNWGTITEIKNFKERHNKGVACNFVLSKDFYHIKAKADKLAEALEKIIKSFTVDYYDAKAVLADLEDEHKIAVKALKDWSGE